jgi:hypothetical protein
MYGDPGILLKLSRYNTLRTLRLGYIKRWSFGVEGMVEYPEEIPRNTSKPKTGHIRRCTTDSRRLTLQTLTLSSVSVVSSFFLADLSYK